MRIVITGGLGFLGSELTKAYLNQGHYVTIIDNKSTACIDETELLNTKIKYINVDLANLNDSQKFYLQDEISRADFIYHFASSVGVQYIDHHPEHAIQNINKININFFEIVKDFNIPVIFASTSEVYGNNSNAKETDDLVIKNPEYLRGGYACAKLMAEYLIKTYKFPYLILRFFNVTGNKQLSVHGMVMPKFNQLALHNEDLTIYDDGMQIRSFCDVRDAIGSIFKLVHEEKIFNETFNIGNSSNTTTIKDLAIKIIASHNSTSKIVFKNFNSQFQKHTHEIQTRIVNNDKIKQYYQFQYTLEDIIKSFKE